MYKHLGKQIVFPVCSNWYVQINKRCYISRLYIFRCERPAEFKLKYEIEIANIS